MNGTIIKRIRDLDFSQEFLIDDINGERYTYSHFFSCCFAMGENMRKLTNRDTIIVIMENSCCLAMLYFAAIFANKRIAVIDPQKGKEEIEQIVNGMSGYPIICDDNFTEVYSERIINVEVQEFNIVEAESIKNIFLSSIEDCSNRTGYLITFTSGTSGIAKGVEHSLENLFLTASSLSLKIEADHSTFLHVMPMTYMAGILNSIFYPFLIGATIVLTKRFSIMNARSFWKIVKKYKCNLFWLSPSMLMMIDKMDRTDLGREYCSNNKTMFLIGTAPLTNETRKQFNMRYGVKVLASYGLSETLFVSVETHESLIKSNKNCVGELLDGVKYIVENSGELLVAVPWMFLGYTNEDTKKYFSKDNYYKTGDLVNLENNYLYITGRSKDLIIKGGINISPSRIEEVVEQIPAIEEVAVVGVPDSKNEERILCVYTLVKSMMKNEDYDSCIKKRVLEVLGKNYTIDYSWQLDTIPKNINGKVDKKMIQRLWKEK